MLKLFHRKAQLCQAHLPKPRSDPETTVVAPTDNTDMATHPGNAHMAQAMTLPQQQCSGGKFCIVALQALH